MSLPRLEPAANKTNLFDTDAGSLPSTSDDFQPRAISEQTFVTVTSVLAAALVVVILIGSVYFILRRRLRQDNNDGEQQDVEQSLLRAQRPTLTIDTGSSPANDLTSSAGRATLPNPPRYSEVPCVPLLQVRTAPPSIYGSGLNAFDPVRFHSATRSSSGSHPPGISGRHAMMPVYQDSTFEEISFREPMQAHNPHDTRINRYV